jgi:hypothetical protein
VRRESLGARTLKQRDELRGLVPEAPPRQTCRSDRDPFLDLAGFADYGDFHARSLRRPQFMQRSSR